MNSYLCLCMYTLSLSTCIDNDWHGSIVHWLRAVRPEVWALSQINVARAQAAKREEGQNIKHK
jgi:hypothetical protein